MYLLQFNQSTVNLLSQNNNLRDNLGLQRKKNIVDNNILLKSCVDKDREIFRAQYTIGKFRQNANIIQNRAEITIGNLKSEIARLNVECHEKQVIIQGIRLQMNRQIQIREQMLQQYQKLNEQLKICSKTNQNNLYPKQNKKILASEQQNQLQYTRNNFSIAQLVNENQRLKHQIFKLQKLLQEQKKKNNTQRKQTTLQINKFQQKNQQKGKEISQSVQKFNKYQQINILQQYSIMSIQKWQKLLCSTNNIRNGINRQVFSIFIHAARQAQNKKRNGLTLFLNKWKQIQITRLTPYVKAYFQICSSILNNSKNHQNIVSQLVIKINQFLPIRLCVFQPQKLPHELQIKSPQVYKTHIKLKQALKTQKRSQLNLWVLSTIDFTNNQYEMNQQNLKNNLLYLFRLLTIQFRVQYPPVGKQKEYTLDIDVRNCLLHFILVAVRQVVSLA